MYLVATPIGNLEDITGRALRVLSQVSLIAAEDTRQARKLLEHYQIRTPVISYYEHNKLSRLKEVLAALSSGDVALISDAGTPALNDPGYELVREALRAGFPVSPIPGACAPISALVASGLPTDAFLYLGYLPRKSTARRRFLQEISQLPFTLLFLEAPHRLLATLHDLEEVLGNRQITVARELTKLHEEFFRGSVQEAISHFTQQVPRGEFTLILSGNQSKREIWSEERLTEVAKEHLQQGEVPSRIAAQLATMSGWSKRSVYRLLMQIQTLEGGKSIKKGRWTSIT